jgi:hypothetical protein
MSPPKFIQSAIKNPGSFTRQAKREGLTVPQFTKKVLNNKSKFSTLTVRRATLARTLSRLSKKR